MRLTANNHNITYNIKRICIGCPTAMVLYSNGLNARLIHQDKNGYYICKDSSKIYFDKEMNEYLLLQGIVGVSEDVEKEILKI